MKLRGNSRVAHNCLDRSLCKLQAFCLQLVNSGEWVADTDIPGYGASTL